MGSACWWSRQPKPFWSGAVCARRLVRSSKRSKRDEEEVETLARACARAGYRARGAVRAVDLLARAVVDLVQPVHQRVHGRAPRGSAGAQSGGEAAPSVGGLRQDLA